MQAIIDACHAGDIDAEVVAVISNVPGAGGLNRAKRAGIAAHTIDHQSFVTRDAFEDALSQCIDQHKPDLIVLAGFMRVLSARAVSPYLGRMLNIHPSLLPQLPGLHTHRRALDAGLSQHGASVHFVTPALDAGPLVVQAAVDVLEDDSPESLAARVLEQEHRIYPAAVRWFAAGHLRYENESALFDGITIRDPIGQSEYV